MKIFEFLIKDGLGLYTVLVEPKLKRILFLKDNIWELC